jgi:hypothetical protein
MKRQLTKDERKYLLDCKINLFKVNLLRTYPNGKEMDLLDAKILNYLGKTSEFLSSAIEHTLNGKIDEKRDILRVLGRITSFIEMCWKCNGLSNSNICRKWRKL